MEKVNRSRSELLRRYFVFVIALFFISLGVSLITRSLVGTSPISSIPYVMSLNTALSMGTFILILNLVLMVGQMLMLGADGIRKCKVDLLMQLPVSVAFGLFVDMTMAMLAFYQPENYVVKLSTIALGCVSMAIGISLEVIADVSMVSGEYFVHIASQRFKKEFGVVKIMFDISLVVIAVGCSWILAGRIDGVREGTLLTALLTGPLVRLFMPRLAFVGRWESEESKIHTGATDSTGSSHCVITIAREYGSGGHDIGRMIAERLGIRFWDNTMMAMVAKESGFSEEKVREYDQRLPHSLLYEMVFDDYSVPVERSMSMKDALFVAQSRVIRRLADEGACVIVGRCSDYVLQDKPDCIHIYLHASTDYKIKRAIEYYSIPADKASATVAQTNSARAAHYAYYTGKRWDDTRNYHAVFDTSKMSAEAICDAVCRLYNANISECTAASAGGNSPEEQSVAEPQMI
ncbi:MAG: cytidylate kinase family protein [Muribaculaceae bacterium]|nr:cytidylate kinase family protein [Muribaculaceae bacterium]